MPPKPAKTLLPNADIEVVAGLDTASSKLHLVCSNGQLHHLTIPDKDKLSPDERRHKLFDCARVVFSLLPRNTLICAEEPLALKNGKTTRLLALAAGAIWAAHLYHEVFWVWVDVSNWKKEVVGNGNANKAQIIDWVGENMNLQFEASEPDYADAACLMRWGELKLGLA